ncbi:hypothetical protein PG993_005234 [Apiospora rasikravindrae]|uniref:Uncharacterized protein n=1 Tax=Apiospora rasikravindrae TaxID=990691 RepID=A0ABR1TF09_9PEZI
MQRGSSKLLQVEQQRLHQRNWSISISRGVLYGTVGIYRRLDVVPVRVNIHRHVAVCAGKESRSRGAGVAAAATILVLDHDRCVALVSCSSSARATIVVAGKVDDLMLLLVTLRLKANIVRIIIRSIFVDAFRLVTYIHLIKTVVDAIESSIILWVLTIITVITQGAACIGLGVIAIIVVVIHVDINAAIIGVVVHVDINTAVIIASTINR